MPSDLKRIKCLSITKAIQQMYKMASKQFEQKNHKHLMQVAKLLYDSE